MGLNDLARVLARHITKQTSYTQNIEPQEVRPVRAPGEKFSKSEGRGGERHLNPRTWARRTRVAQREKASQ